MGSNIKLHTFLVFISLLACSCQKEITAPEDPNSTALFSLDQQISSAQQYARVQNFMNDFLTSAFSGAITHPEFYGIDMASTQTFCPFTELSSDGDILTMQFGEDATEEGSCTVLNYTQVGGTLALNKNFCSDIISTRSCQPGSLQFDEMNVRGCSIEAIRNTDNESLHPVFYTLDGCPDLSSGIDANDEIVNFWFAAKEEWKMNLTDPNGKSTIFDPINNDKGAFMQIKAPNLFGTEVNFEDLYDANYQISLPRQASHDFNGVIFQGAGEEGEDLRMLVTTTEDLVYAPYQCKNIISGKILLMDLNCKPLISIDYGAGTEENAQGECDNVVKICPCDESGDAMIDSPDCIVTGCLPL